MKQQIAYIGNCSKNGIYKYRFYNGKLIKIYNTNDFERCTYLANDDAYLYSVLEIQDTKEQNNGYIVAYKKCDNKLINIDKKISYGQNPCHIAISNKKNLLFVSNYTDGNFTVFQKT